MYKYGTLKTVEIISRKGEGKKGRLMGGMNQTGFNICICRNVTTNTSV
jgi:hypothetical protein